MKTRLLPKLTSSALIAGTAASLSLVSAIAPFDLLNLTQQGRPQQAFAQDAEENTNVRVYRQASPAVVSIDTRTGAGSGVIISPDGLILTNAHVVSGAQRVTVTLADGTKAEGDVIAFGEAGLDLAAVRLRGRSGLPTVAIAAPDSIEVGQRAFAIGNPFGRFQNTFTDGIVSRIDRNRGIIQTNAAINPGNSGGPLLNSRAELIGINSAIFSPRGSGGGGNIGIGFAISTDRIQNFLVAVREGRAPRVASQSPVLGGGRPAQPLSLNTPVQGTLDNSSGVLPSDNSFYNAYTFQGRRGQRVVIEMTSDQIDSYLILLAPDGRDLAQDDDAGGGKNARMTATLPADGTYTVLANAYQPGETGRYTLRLDTSRGTAQTPPANTRPNRVAAGGTTPQDRARVILQEQGILDASAPVLRSDGSRYREYTFSGTAGQTVTITLESGDFDTYLMLIDPSNRMLRDNDDAAPDNTNSTLTVTLPATGTYKVIANAYDRSGQGQFTLTVRGQ